MSGVPTSRTAKAGSTFSAAPRHLAIALLAALALGFGIATTGSSALAEPGSGHGATKTPHKKKPAQKLRSLPNDQRLMMLVTSTLLALNQANLTGNYSVFRELAAPGFQAVNSVGKLSDIFADLRHKNFDLAPIAVLTPKLIRRPEITSAGLLRVAGFFPTAPERLNFDLIYQMVGGRWLLFGIAANTTPFASGKAESVVVPQPDIARRKN